MTRINNLQDVVKTIAKMDTLSIPCVNNGTPYVRLDEIADILDHIPVANVDLIYERINNIKRITNDERIVL